LRLFFTSNSAVFFSEAVKTFFPGAGCPNYAIGLYIGVGDGWALAPAIQVYSGFEMIRALKLGFF